MNFLRRLWRDNDGQDMVEWAVLIALVALGTSAFMFNSGSSVSKVWTTANTTLSGQTPATTQGGGGSGNGGSGEHDGGHDR